MEPKMFLIIVMHFLNMFFKIPDTLFLIISHICVINF